MNKSEKNAGSHNDNRNKVCVICFGKNSRCNKSKFVPIIPQGKIENMIQNYFEYEASNERLPNAICGKCLRKLYRSEDIVPPNLSDFKAMIFTRPVKKVQDQLLPCKCRLCQIVRQPIIVCKGITSYTYNTINRS